MAVNYHLPPKSSPHFDEQYLVGTGGTQAASAGAGSVVKLDLAVKTYVEVECPEALAQGRAGGALGAGAGGGGIAQKCVQVKVRLCNPTLTLSPTQPGMRSNAVQPQPSP